MQLDKVIVAGIAIIAALAIILFISGACAACLFLGNVSNNVGNEFPVEHREDKTVHAAAPNVDLDVTTIGGKVEIVDSADGNVEVVYDVFASPGHLDDVRTGTDYSQSGDTLKIRAEAKIPDIDRLVNIGVTRGANVIVKLPKDAKVNLNLNTLGGDIVVPERNGGRMELNSMGGKIRVNGGQYSTVKATTAGGDIYARYGATYATFETMGGGIYLDANQTTGSLKATTAGGDIDVTLPDGTLFTIDASTMGGQVRHGYIPMDATTENDMRLVGKTEAGPGTLDIELRTMGGDVEIGY
jgi:hypothetical protein